MIKSKPILPSLLALGLAAGVGSARADQGAVERAEKQVQECASDADLNRRYSGQLYYLARVYRENGMRQKSDETFQKYMEIWRKGPHPDSEESMMLGWALSLLPERRHFCLPDGSSPEDKKRLIAQIKADHQADLAKAAEIADRCLANTSRMQQTSQEKIELLFSVLTVYRYSNQSQKAQQVISQLDTALHTMEQDGSLPSDRIRYLANALIQLSDVYAPVGNWRQTISQPPVGLLPNNAPKDTYSVTDQDFSMAEGYRRRAMAQFDRLPTNDRYRVEAHRSLVAWYRLYGHTQMANDELRKLQQLVGSNDPNVALPQPRYCPACGRG